MNMAYILCVDDQRGVLGALLKDLEEFQEGFGLIGCESAREAREELGEIEAAANDDTPYMTWLDQPTFYDSLRIRI